MTTYFFPIFSSIMAVFLLGIGLRVLITGRPLLLNARWQFVIMVLAFSPMLINSSVRLLKSPFGSTSYIFFLSPLIFLVMLIFFWIQMKGYTAIGITDDSFRAAIHSALQQLNIEFKESLALIELSALNIDLQVSVQSWIGTGQLKAKQAEGNSIVKEIANAMADYYQINETKTNNITSIFYLFLGLIMLGLTTWTAFN